MEPHDMFIPHHSEDPEEDEHFAAGYKLGHLVAVMIHSDDVVEADVPRCILHALVHAAEDNDFTVALWADDEGDGEDLKITDWSQWEHDYTDMHIRLEPVVDVSMN